MNRPTILSVALALTLIATPAVAQDTGLCQNNTIQKKLAEGFSSEKAVCFVAMRDHSTPAGFVLGCMKHANTTKLSFTASDEREWKKIYNNIQVSFEALTQRTDSDGDCEGIVSYLITCCGIETLIRTPFHFRAERSPVSVHIVVE